MFLNPNRRILVFFFLSISFFNCQREPETETSPNPKISKLKLPGGFKVEHLYNPSKELKGSWVSMTFDNKGRLIASDQYGSLYRLEIAPLGTDSVYKIEKLPVGQNKTGQLDSLSEKVEMGFAQGLLYAFNSLYVMVNNWEGNEHFGKSSGLYRLQDTDNDDQFDKVTLLKKLEGDGEHGPHSIVLSPDKKSLYVVAGNFTKLPEMDAYRLPPVWQEDNLFPLITDPRGHATEIRAPGGWIARLDSAGNDWELISAGYRNTYDIAFNADGELFAYDSDMEWDFGTPWYRPTRICHVTSGSEYGWRTGNSVWSPAFPDNLPPVINIGQGSPTNLVNALNSGFPPQYKNALLAFDWSFGIIYAVHLQPEGSSYTATAEEFLSGSPLPLTDGTFGPDGALYFITGGRNLESDLYRIYYDGNTAAANALSVDASANSDARQIRRQLESIHRRAGTDAVELARKYLKHEDRFIRYAARVALEHQPIELWKSDLAALKDPNAIIETSIAIAHQGKPGDRDLVLQALLNLDFKSLTDEQKINITRATELALLRLGNPDAGMRKKLVDYLDAEYPSSSNRINQELGKLLAFLESDSFVRKTIPLLETAIDDTDDETASESANLIFRNPQYGMDIASMLSKVPPRQQTFYATVLMNTKKGWTPELREKYFTWFRKAFEYKGGMSYIGFINKARLAALDNVPKAEFERYNKLSGGDLLSSSGNSLAVTTVEPKGPWREWTVALADSVLDGKMTRRNFEFGKQMYAAVRCLSCHQMRGEGGVIGPDLSQLGTRFTTKDMLEAIIEPNKTVSDQFAATIFTMRDGTTIFGRLVDENEKSFIISQNPFAPDVTRDVPKENVITRKYSHISIMYPGLINRLNEEELADLMAYLMSGGDKDHEVYKVSNQIAN